MIVEAFDKYGLSRSLDLVDKIYSRDSTFGSTCHDIGHLLGSKTFKLFKQGKDFEITSKVAFCSYGFYHGFMEILASEGDVKRARDFCKYVDSRVSKETPDATLQCFHGIGHGWVNIHGDKALVGNDLGIAKKGLSLCREVASTDSELSRCATGVFNGLSVFYANEEYGLKINKSDPMWICKKVEKEFQDPCYVSMNAILFSITGGDFRSSAKYIESIDDDVVASHAMINLSLPFSLSEINNNDHSKSVAVCKSLQDRLIIPCFQGFAFAFMEHGEPGKEYVRAVEFCKVNGLTDKEEKGCLSYIYSYMAQWYPKEKAYSICRSENGYEQLCKEKLEEGINGLPK